MNTYMCTCTVYNNSWVTYASRNCKHSSKVDELQIQQQITVNIIAQYIPPHVLITISDRSNIKFKLFTSCI